MSASWQRWQAGLPPLHLAFCLRQFSQALLTRLLDESWVGYVDRGIGTLGLADRSLELERNDLSQPTLGSIFASDPQRGC